MEEIVTKADWKLFRERLPGWQERFMEKLVNDYSKMLKDKSMPASEKFWKLEDRIKKSVLPVSCVRCVSPKWSGTLYRSAVRVR